ncbi:porphobilinogen deaminase [Aspergillus bombycis]|uniref:hydroxymethylbilane synthase n=1 Tax=Aspergillus bombycis TaxID=109264 RepID=A0A1F7ZKA0_9EURO|nr:porphobilinogen deaminase [Aspergillus bombycis]OGM39871.1 porphobilinogen deaminase [Aspergillus bombycis]
MGLDVNSCSKPQHKPEEEGVIIGCRKSELALVQTRSIISKLGHTLDPSPNFQIATGSVVGDADKQTSFAALSKLTGGSDVGKSLWTNDLELDLVAGKVHCLVHSLKDMPTTLPPHCLLGAIPEREDCSDAVCIRPDLKFTSIDQLPPGSIVGTSSSRRKALVRRNWPHLEVVECRGNVDTRLAKLDAPSSPFSCILLATAGLLRLGLGHRITHRLDTSIFPYAVGQGALGVEISTNRPDILELVRHVDHKPSRWRGIAERAMLRSLQGGCSSPIGVRSSLEPLKEENRLTEDTRRGRDGSGGNLTLQAMVLHIEGTSEIVAEDAATVQCDEEAEKLGVSVANMLLRKGARTLMPKQF